MLEKGGFTDPNSSIQTSKTGPANVHGVYNKDSSYPSDSMVSSAFDQPPDSYQRVKYVGGVAHTVGCVGCVGCGYVRGGMWECECGYLLSQNNNTHSTTTTSLNTTTSFTPPNKNNIRGMDSELMTGTGGWLRPPTDSSHTLTNEQLMSLQASQAGTAMLDMRDVVYDDPPIKLGRGGFGEVCDVVWGWTACVGFDDGLL